MVRFSCFQTNTHCSKSKKEFQRPAESISKAIEDCSQVRGIKASGVPSYPDFKSNSLEQVFSSSSLDRFSNSEDMHTISDISQMTHLRKSQSLGSALNREGKVSSSVNSEDEVDQGFSSNHSDEHNEAGNLTSLHHHVMVQPFHSKDPETSPPNQYEMCLAQESSPANDDVLHTETFSSSEDTGHDSLPNQLSSEHADYSGRSTPGIPPTIEKSQSVPNFGVFSPTGEKGSPSHMHVATRSRSFMDLNELDEEREEVQNHEAHFHAMEDEERDRGIFESITDKCDDFSPDRYESYSFINSVKDWTLSGMDEVDMMKKHEKEPPVNSWDELPTKDFKIKRIEEWVSTIDLGESSPLKDQTEPSFAVDKVKKGSHVVGSATTAKLDSKSTHGMEAAKKYLASLTATSTSAQLGNLGLVVIPFLSAFVSLKVLNLSGNSIVRITAGALPRGLHALNLAKNKISTIEGLRELTRLRVLDLSYNRILRIGHGLASCSSLKELYLAGNKISEVEGLHRLLKLNILDLRFNKISTAKCLGQLAANYSSLQAINLEGNPAQRNVGDEHMKKYLQSLLPHLVYFNKQSIKANSSKEVADRSARSVITSHQFDRGLRSDHKLNRKGKLIAAPSKASTSGHVHRSHAVNSPKRSKDQRHLPPPATKGSHHRHHFLDLGTKLLSLKPDLRRSRSEGNLGGS